jgi:hypothetical protein
MLDVSEAHGHAHSCYMRLDLYFSGEIVRRTPPATCMRSTDVPLKRWHCLSTENKRHLFKYKNIKNKVPVPVFLSSTHR